MMKNTVSPIEILREEFCSRYGLNPEQISFDVTIKEVSKELAGTICRDYSKHAYSFTAGKNMAYTWNDNFWLYANYTKEGEEDDQS